MGGRFSQLLSIVLVMCIFYNDGAIYNGAILGYAGMEEKSLGTFIK